MFVISVGAEDVDLCCWLEKIPKRVSKADTVLIKLSVSSGDEVEAGEVPVLLPGVVGELRFPKDDTEEFRLDLENGFRDWRDGLEF